MTCLLTLWQVVVILLAILVGLWAMLSWAQRGHIGRFPVAVIRNVLSHWIQVQCLYMVLTIMIPTMRLGA